MSWFLILTLLCALAAAEEPPSEEPSADPSSEPTAADPGLVSFATALAEAKSLYFLGENERALARLDQLALRLQAGEEAAWSSIAECFVYKGEIHFLQGEDASARRAFRVVLLQDPDHAINPYHHPLEVIGLYETVRRQVKAELATRTPDPGPLPPVMRRPLPVWGVLPFGLPQFGQGQRGKGVAYASAQVGLAAGSIVSFAAIARLNASPPEAWPESERTARLQRLKFGVQWPVTAAFYTLWAVSVGDSAASWRRSARGDSRLSIQALPDADGRPIPGGARVGFQRSF